MFLILEQGSTILLDGIISHGLLVLPLLLRTATFVVVAQFLAFSQSLHQASCLFPVWNGSGPLSRSEDGEEKREHKTCARDIATPSSLFFLKKEMTRVLLFKEN
jgi:hypothetical protein